MFDFRVVIFGEKQIVSALATFQRKMKFRVFGRMKRLAREYAEEMVVEGMPIAGLRSRSGRLARVMKVDKKRTHLGKESASVLVYPGAEDDRGHRYPWMLAYGSQKAAVDVREFIRMVPGRGGSGRRIQGKFRGRLGKLGRSKEAALTVGDAGRVRSHRRLLSMKPRPFMSGGALTRMEANFMAQMEQQVREAIEKTLSEMSVEDAQTVRDADPLGLGG